MEAQYYHLPSEYISHAVRVTDEGITYAVSGKLNKARAITLDFTKSTPYISELKLQQVQREGWQPITKEEFKAIADKRLVKEHQRWRNQQFKRLGYK